MPSKIEWTDESWNPIVGCSKVSAGCENCYAETAAASPRLQQFEQYQNVIDFEVEKNYGQVVGHSWNGKTAFIESALNKPLHWKKPRMIFVCSMGDLFHESVPFEWIDRVISIVALCPRHTFMFLTKRAERMAEYFSSLNDITRDSDRDMTLWDAWRVVIAEREIPDKPMLPLPNLWLGVTAENQEMANKRIPVLLQIPAAKRFVSVEPMLGEVRLNLATPCDRNCNEYQNAECPGYKGICVMQHAIDWVICGCESGGNRRPMDIEWARAIRDQCKSAGVPFFMKQMEIPLKSTKNILRPQVDNYTTNIWAWGGKVCKDISQFPVELQVREFPEVTK